MGASGGVHCSVHIIEFQCFWGPQGEGGGRVRRRDAVRAAREQEREAFAQRAQKKNVRTPSLCPLPPGFPLPCSSMLQAEPAQLFCLVSECLKQNVRTCCAQQVPEEGCANMSKCSALRRRTCEPFPYAPSPRLPSAL